MDGRDERAKKFQPALHETFTPLKEPRVAILAAIEGTGIISFPPRTSEVMGRNQDAYCRFHDARGHHTEHCRALRYKLEELVQQGRLDAFIQKGEGNRENRGRERRNEGGPLAGRGNNGRQGEQGPPVNNWAAHNAIHVISGGETMAGSTSSSKKSYAREAYQVNSVMRVSLNEEPITFTPEDQGDVLGPHDDPLVITAVIAKHLVSRILVDNGSSVNLIYKNCFEQMHLAQERLKKVITPLYSFTGDSVAVE